MTFKLGHPWTGSPTRSLCMDCLSTPHRYVGTKIHTYEKLEKKYNFLLVQPDTVLTACSDGRILCHDLRGGSSSESMLAGRFCFSLNEFTNVRF